MTRRLRASVLVAALSAASCSDDAAPPGDAMVPPADASAAPDVPFEDDVPFDVGADVDPVLVRGASLFRRYCATCHGVRGTGTADGPDLRVEAPTVSDAEVLRLLTSGGRRMPSIPIDEAQRAEVLAYLRATFGAFRETR